MVCGPIVGVRCECFWENSYCPRRVGRPAPRILDAIIPSIWIPVTFIPEPAGANARQLSGRSIVISDREDSGARALHSFAAIPGPAPRMAPCSSTNSRPACANTWASKGRGRGGRVACRACPRPRRRVFCLARRHNGPNDRLFVCRGQHRGNFPLGWSALSAGFRNRAFTAPTAAGRFWRGWRPQTRSRGNRPDPASVPTVSSAGLCSKRHGGR
jgi:hypothetical protein